MDRSNSFIRLWAQLLSPVLLFAIPWSEACQTPLSVGFPQQEYWSGLSFLSDLGIESASPILASRLFASEPRGKPSFSCQKSYIHSLPPCLCHCPLLLDTLKTTLQVEKCSFQIYHLISMIFSSLGHFAWWRSYFIILSSLCSPEPQGLHLCSTYKFNKSFLETLMDVQLGFISSVLFKLFCIGTLLSFPPDLHTIRW